MDPIQQFRKEAKQKREENFVCNCIYIHIKVSVICYIFRLKLFKINNAYQNLLDTTIKHYLPFEISKSYFLTKKLLALKMPGYYLKRNHLVHKESPCT